ncbi:hypothetical protein [Polycladomyces subterraneus]|uniref:Chitin synthase export chaperone n=1 Tax=Polycladomyces subterraneus TaxID=1016997 RepID=A0ABT8ILA7_9BACL|nr:hypothetical protein [Polycladomyces subterraneus]MDN4593531.1 hypothetical protein [Polycladomyces subterraneus]
MKTPLGVRILAVIQIIYGSVVALVQGLNGNIGLQESICTPIRGCGGITVTYQYLLFVVIVIGLIPVIGGFGMLLKKTWGWWMSTGYLSYLLLSEVGNVIDALFRPSTSVDISLFYILIVGLLLLYLLKDRVTHSFEVMISRSKMIAWLFGAAVSVWILYEVILFSSSV